MRDERQKSGVRIQNPEYQAETAFLLTPDFWILDSAFLHPLSLIPAFYFPPSRCYIIE